MLGNADVRISYAVSSADLALYRNAIGDECVYVERGSATVETVFGALTVGQGDYVILPRATTHRWVPTGDEPLRTYAIEANSHIAPPKRYLSKYGQLLEHSPYCERDLRGPAEPLLGEGTDVEVYVKHRGDGPGGLAGSVHVVPEHPFDVVGWDGCLYPYVFNVADFEPITGRVHQPPPVHQVFEGQNFVVCNFVPRKVDYHPLAVPVPYYHSNVDSDEVMFYVDGDYEARKGSGIGQGSISLHPGGHCARPAARRGRAVPGRGVLRRAGGHGRHLPAARSRRGRHGHGRREVRLDLVGPRALGMTWLDLPADTGFGLDNLPYGIFSTPDSEPPDRRRDRRPRARPRRVHRRPGARHRLAERVHGAGARGLASAARADHGRAHRRGRAGPTSSRTSSPATT